MKKITSLVSCILLGCAISVSGCGGGSNSDNVSTKSSTDVELPENTDFLSFPSDFLWGSGTAAYQVEGAYLEDGKGYTNWDYLTNVARLANGETGNVAIDQYHRYKEDVKLMADSGMKFYRFSISWARIYPTGYPYEVDSSGNAVLDDDGNTVPVDPNAAGIAYYNNLIDELLANNIEPVITLFHWDVPMLVYAKGSFANRDTLPLFDAYAKTVFEEFGDRVTRFTTLNEPYGYSVGLEGIFSIMASAGNLSSESLLAMMKNMPTEKLFGTQLTTLHNYLLAHARAVHIYHQLVNDGKVKAGTIGSTFDLSIGKPATDSDEDVAAAKTYNQLRNDIFTWPLFKGEYPEEIIAKLKEDGYGFSISDEQLQEDLAFMKENPGDFTSVNYYSRNTISHTDKPDEITENWTMDRTTGSGLLFDDIWIENHPDSPSSSNGPYDPQGFYDTIMYLDDISENKPIIITENGASYSVEEKLTSSGEVHDTLRTRYLKGHIQAVWLANQNGANVIGYSTWSLADNFEWFYGYNVRFGTIYIDYNDDLKRYPKDSFYWFKNTITNNGVDSN